MPVGWFGFSTASAPEVHERRENPRELREWVRQLMAENGGELQELYFEIGRRDYACALVYGLDNPVNQQRVIRKLQADETRKFLPPDDQERSLDSGGTEAEEPPPSAGS